MPARLLFYFMGAWLLLIGLVAFFLGRKNHKGPKKGWMVFFAAGMLFIFWGACGGYYSIFMFTERLRAHRSLDPNAAVAIELLPGTYPAMYPPLVPQRLVATDRHRIEQVVRALTAAEPWAAAHPKITWQCLLRVDDGARKHSYLVSSTTNNGVLIEVVDSEGWVVGEYREDVLKEVLEQIAAARQNQAD